jgi:hypothetical protein
MTSIEDTFSSDSSSSSFSSLSALANNLPALRIESENEADTAATPTAASTTTTAQATDALTVPNKKLARASIDSNFFSANINYGEVENTSLADLKSLIIKRNLKAENPNIELNEKLDKPIVEFFDLDTKTCRINSLVIDYAKNMKVNFEN